MSILHHGATLQTDATLAVQSRPASPLVARLVGIKNIFDGEIVGHDRGRGLTHLRWEGTTPRGAPRGGFRRRRARGLVRAVVAHRPSPQGSPVARRARESRRGRDHALHRARRDDGRRACRRDGPAHGDSLFAAHAHGAAQRCRRRSSGRRLAARRRDSRDAGRGRGGGPVARHVIAGIAPENPDHATVVVGPLVGVECGSFSFEGGVVRAQILHLILAQFARVQLHDAVAALARLVIL